ncbi:hypothetical protein FB451DRAFT_1369734 [Mycena latifolia]|nr:hypothetical protein FB451DRAFT_1369734 [Mycena latifolia]
METLSAVNCSLSARGPPGINGSFGEGFLRKPGFPITHPIWEGFLRETGFPIRIIPAIDIVRRSNYCQWIIWCNSGSEVSEPPPAPAPQRRRVKITPWRILNTAVLLILGTTKALSTFLGQTNAPNNLDWTIGVVWALISYWVSLVEQETPEVAPWFFTTDFSGVLRLGFTGFLVMLVVAAFWSIIYGLMALTFGRLIHHPPILHGLSVGFVGLIPGSCLAYENSSTNCASLDLNFTMAYSIVPTGPPVFSGFLFIAG